MNKEDRFIEAYEFVHACQEETLNEFARFINKKIVSPELPSDKINILDLGIGYGTVSLKVAKKLSQNVRREINWYGIDIEEDLSYIREQLSKEGAILSTKQGWEILRFPHKSTGFSNLTFFLKKGFNIEQDSIEELKGKFDIVYAPWFFHHIIEWKKVLTRIHKILKENGYLIIQFSGGIFNAYDGNFSRYEEASSSDKRAFLYWKKFWDEIINQIRYNWVEQTDLSANNYDLLIQHIDNFDHIWQRIDKNSEPNLAFDFNATLYDYEKVIDLSCISPLKTVKYFFKGGSEFDSLIEKAKDKARKTLNENMDSIEERRTWKIAVYKKKEYKKPDLDYDFYDQRYEGNLNSLKNWVEKLKNLNDEKQKERIIKDLFERHSLKAIKDFNRPIILPYSNISRDEVLNSVLTTRLINILIRENLIPKVDLLYGVANLKLDGKFAINFFSIKDKPNFFKALSFIEYWIESQGLSFSKYLLKDPTKSDLHVVFSIEHKTSIDHQNKSELDFKFDKDKLENLSLNYQTKLYLKKNRKDLMPKSYYTLCEENLSDEENRRYENELETYRKWENEIIKEIKEDEIDLFRTCLVNISNYLKSDCELLPVLWNYSAKIVMAYEKEIGNSKFISIGTGAFIIATEQPAHQIVEDYLKDVLDVFYSKMSIWKWKEITQNEMKQKGLKAAVASIMARNMSHNIGSHVLNNLSDPAFTKTFKDSIEERILRKSLDKEESESCYKLRDILNSKFQEYLRERMDLVAAIPTNAPIWSLSLEAKKDITNRLSENLDLSKDSYNIPKLSDAKISISGLFLLFDNIVQSEGITAEKLEFIPRFYGPNQKLKTKEDLKDLKTSIYGGVLGTQCIYIILENFIRNSAKFGSKLALEKIKNNSDKLKIYIDFYESWHISEKDSIYQEDFIKVEVYDNLGGWPRERKTTEETITEKIDGVISPKLDPLDPEGSLVDEDGKIREGNWGSKEMRIAASYLRGIPIEEIENPISGEPDIIEAFPVKNKLNENFKTLDVGASLGYRFFLKKPKNILIISSGEDIKNVCSPYEDFKADGIEIVSYNEFKTKISKFTHEFFILDLREEETLTLYKDKNLLFPIKTLFIYDGNQDDVKENLKEYFKNEEKIPEFLITLNELDTVHWLAELIEYSNIGKKDSVKNLYDNNLSKIDKFRLNIMVKWYKIFSNEDFNVSIYRTVFKQKKMECLTASGYSGYSLNLLHPDINSFKQLHREDIEKSNYLCFFSTGIHNIFKFFYGAFVELNNSSFKRDDLYLIIKAFEVALYNIIIIDERIFKAHQKIKSIAKGKFKTGDFWYVQNAVFFDMERDKIGNIAISYYSFEWESLWNNTSLKDESEPFCKKSDDIKFEEILPLRFKENVHFMIVHIGIIDKIGGKEKFEEWLKELPPEYKPWFLLIDSGRGHPEGEKIPGNARFQDFSNLRKYIIEEPDKYILSNVILNARE